MNQEALDNLVIMIFPTSVLLIGDTMIAPHMVK